MGPGVDPWVHLAWRARFIRFVGHPCKWHFWVAVFCAFHRVFSCVFPALQMWVPADDNLPKIMELISYKPYI